MDKQKIMERYSKLVMKRLYHSRVKIYFRDIDGLRGIHRNKYFPPYSMDDYEEWKKHPVSSITFHNILFSKLELAPHAWNTIVHEVSHHGVKFDSNYLWKHNHDPEFKKGYFENLKKVDDLRKNFNIEVGFPKNFLYDDEEEEDEEELEEIEN